MSGLQYKVDMVGDDHLSPELKKVRQNFEQINSSGAPVRKKIAEIKKQMEEMVSLGERKNPMFDRLADAAKWYQKELDSVKEATKRATKETNKLGNALTKAAGFSTAATGVLGLIGPAGNDAAQAILRVQSAMATLQGLQASLGGSAGALANPYVAMGAAVIGAGAAWVSYNKEMETTLRRTEQFTGLSGDALMSLRNGIKSVASTWGKDYNSVLSSVDGMMAQYGISGEKALQIIRDGFVSGADDAGKMQDLISRYSGSFKDAGISADELVAIIANTRSGIFSEDGMQLIEVAGKNIRLMSDKAAESLKQIGIDSDEMTAKLQSGELETVDALKQISSQLKKMPPQSQEVGKVLQDIFGKKGAAAGYELVTALADVNTNLDEMMLQTGEVGKAQQDLQESERRLEDAMAAVFAVGNGGFETMTTNIKAKVLGALADVIDRFINLYNNCGLVRGAIVGIGMTLAITWDTIKMVLKLMCEAFVGLSEIVQGVFALDWDAVKNGWNNGVKGILNAVSQFGHEVAEDVTKGIERAGGKIEPIKVPVELDTPTSIKTPTGSETGNGSGTPGTDTGKPVKVTGPKYDTGSLADYRAQLRALDDELTNSGSLTKERIAQIDAERFALQKQIKTLEARQKVLRGETLDKIDGPAYNIKPIKTEEIFKVNKDEINNIAKTYAEKLRAIHTAAQETVDSMRGQVGEMESNFAALANVLRDQFASPADKAAAALGTLGGALSSLGAEGPIAKAGATLAAIGQIILGFATASAQAASLGPFGWLAFVGAGMGALATMISAVKGYATGGIVEGATYHGDKILARVNAGEMILNKRQQGNLWDILDNGASARGMGGRVDFHISGPNLVGTLRNYDNKMSKVR